MAFLVGAGRAFEQPSLQSVLPNIVSAQMLPRAIAAANTASQTAVVAGPALGGALLPILARDVFLTGPIDFGALRAAPGAGAIVAALSLTRHPIARRVGDVMFASVTAYGIATILPAPAPNFILAVAALMVIGAADTISMVIRQTLVQLHTPDRRRGRVFAVNAMFTSTSNQIGTFRAGTMAVTLGPFRRCCSAASAPSRLC